MEKKVAITNHGYFAFISYSHSDRHWANWLHRSMESYRVPRSLQTPELSSRLVAHRMVPVFMDREELSTSPDLGESIRTALERSDCLIVICSPAAAASRWVNEEVRAFLALGRGHRILCLIVAGEPGGGAQKDAALECFPPALRNSEPLAADLRDSADGKHNALLKLIAGMLGVKLDELRRRDQMRRQRRLVWITTAATVGCVVLSGLTVAAWSARNEAERQRQLAVRKSLTAQKTAEFLKSLFAVSDPSEARGNAVTAREILDRGVQKIDQTLADEPVVRSEMLLTMGEVYRGLGLYQQSFDLLARSRSSTVQGGVDWIRETLALADTELQRGNHPQAAAYFIDAEKHFADARLVDRELQAQIWLGRAAMLALDEKYAEARPYLDRAQALASEADLPAVNVAALETRAMADFYEGDMQVAADTYQRAYDARVALSGDTHPKAQELLNGLAAVAYQQREYPAAERAWSKVLEVDRRVLGPHHPDLAKTMNNLGRLWLEQRQYSRAQGLLLQAVSDLEAQQNLTNVTMMLAYSNLALADMGLGRLAAAVPLLDKALLAAAANDHPLQGPLRVYKADALCRQRQFRPGLQLLDQARTFIEQRYAQEPWRKAQLETVAALCLLGVKRVGEASRALDSGLPVLLARWPADSAFGSDGVARAIRVYGEANETDKLAKYQALSRRVMP